MTDHLSRQLALDDESSSLSESCTTKVDAWERLLLTTPELDVLQNDIAAKRPLNIVPLSSNSQYEADSFEKSSSSAIVAEEHSHQKHIHLLKRDSPLLSEESLQVLSLSLPAGHDSSSELRWYFTLGSACLAVTTLAGISLTQTLNLSTLSVLLISVLWVILVAVMHGVMTLEGNYYRSSSGAAMQDPAYYIMQVSSHNSSAANDERFIQAAGQQVLDDNTFSLYHPSCSCDAFSVESSAYRLLLSKGDVQMYNQHTSDHLGESVGIHQNQNDGHLSCYELVRSGCSLHMQPSHTHREVITNTEKVSSVMECQGGSVTEEGMLFMECQRRAVTAEYGGTTTQLLDVFHAANVLPLPDNGNDATTNNTLGAVECPDPQDPPDAILDYLIATSPASSTLSPVNLSLSPASFRDYLPAAVTSIASGDRDKPFILSSIHQQQTMRDESINTTGKASQSLLTCFLAAAEEAQEEGGSQALRSSINNSTGMLKGGKRRHKKMMSVFNGLDLIMSPRRLVHQENDHADSPAREMRMVKDENEVEAVMGKSSASAHPSSFSFLGQNGMRNDDAKSPAVPGIIMFSSKSQVLPHGDAYVSVSLSAAEHLD
ncbi:hypothetical protein CEUSTIGMA_g9285.t1 [Chlamydomonas eustigma]|uniref:Transmembrane protein n=1 Tax=Chlamydomonas eustigma TaxID=1157962 RepID=A0A250XFL2_9CHLO|nr:hypothetical protein CEUSTIGMA_g9285.t1 [Chlamydomonas eustigma]|eukprot:GAX81857.1 hypothetical protein CEUSTIGMA_g9285.t1 [Chlamydomonas eustigma]